MSATTRLIAMGSRPLMEGLALLGFETWPNANTDDVEHLLADLQQNNQKALVLLETSLSQANSAQLKQVRRHGGHIIVTEIPPIHAGRDHHPFIEDLVIKVLGRHALDADS
jgi:vacuolar-type H+-ATPase subunit F/Vma7